MEIHHSDCLQSTFIFLTRLQIIRANLIHRDHPESPLSVPGATSADRYFASASRQSARSARHVAAVEFNTPIRSARPDGAGEYIMTLYFGTPLQKFIVDTRNALVWVQCKPCNSPCKRFNETNPFFDPSASSSYSAIGCANMKCNHTLVCYYIYSSSSFDCTVLLHDRNDVMRMLSSEFNTISSYQSSHFFLLISSNVRALTSRYFFI